MNWIDAQTRLLTDANLRCRFRSNPNLVAEELNVVNSEKTMFVSLNSEAETLLRKRFPPP